MSVDRILNSGDDQLTSQFNLVFPAGIPGGGSGENIALRMDQTFDPPEEATGEYELFFQGAKIVVLNMTDETDKHLTISVRLDQQWTVFDDIMNWKEGCYNPRTGTRLPASDTRIPLLVQALDGQKSIVKTIRFTGVQCKNVKITSFEHNGTDPSRLELQLTFAEMNYE